MDTTVSTRPYTNRLLSHLSASDLKLLMPHLEAVDLHVRQQLELPNQPIEHVYFPEDGIASVVGGNGKLEIGIIGREGVTGLMIVLGNDRSPYETFVQVEGTAQRVTADHLRKAMGKSSELRDLMLRYVQAFMIQTSQTAIANGTSYLPVRLARWLLMCEDRLASKQIPLTHEFFAIMLGVQRPGVTIAIQELEGRGLIRAARGVITIVDRPVMMGLAGDTYGVAEREYARRIDEYAH
jgi:CRP-like cAMP-binding protein